MWPRRKISEPEPSPFNFDALPHEPRPASAPDRSVAMPLPELISSWEQNFQDRRSELEAEALVLREKAARLAPRGERPEEGVSPELRAVGESYAENRNLLERLEAEHDEVEKALLYALEGAQDLDSRLGERREVVAEQLEENREMLRLQPELSPEAAPRISRCLLQLELIDQIADDLHQCRWSSLRHSFNQLGETAWDMADICAVGIGQDPVFADAGIVGRLERLEGRLSQVDPGGLSRVTPPDPGYPYAI